LAHYVQLRSVCCSLADPWGDEACPPSLVLDLGSSVCCQSGMKNKGPPVSLSGQGDTCEEMRAHELQVWTSFGSLLFRGGPCLGHPTLVFGVAADVVRMLHESVADNTWCGVVVQGLAGEWLHFRVLAFDEFGNR
jgi:hypothetical protein